ncbi:hypothetical protein PIB30_033535 [Stylosanthes scabra]|uniref:Uncharacterized protein n=1 Tax=Stylosanthes scabra TaxID=79078 RepID=A0ABU6SCQ4_9FABA|nr:hypothetical protein [Stylosanthes scabra]
MDDVEEEAEKRCRLYRQAVAVGRSRLITTRTCMYTQGCLSRLHREWWSKSEKIIVQRLMWGRGIYQRLMWVRGSTRGNSRTRAFAAHLPQGAPTSFCLWLVAWPDDPLEGSGRISQHHKAVATRAHQESGQVASPKEINQLHGEHGPPDQLRQDVPI